jgi:hypothetical protein
VGRFLLGVATTLLVLAGLAAYVWRYEPERLPAEWRQDNPHSVDYAPVLYRWKDAAGVVQVTDRPPPDRPYETLRIDPDTNVAPLPTPATPPGD